ncbi:TRAP transporter small permease [Roseospira marina]|uniref:TRAP transporter small permease protein n=1 Tax=Roseospira marina TaxID=140057 RepID=A0A5M6I977_9PROT|nr:TRAP transporter small permease [Roseospira marina]KAA5604722.1 TRAP transporter small permease [Roseospira marina]MBB4315172.1 TRAP-type C4-dicarboxylate transport system permease small subunit [Roseospira marina]MBB5088058.1 TRAP-type C4-dicarboxylate transport system permease small subunit [Roseospira marina]
MLTWLARFDRAVGAVLRPAVFVGMVALTAVITLQIVSRVFFTSVSWTEEVARFLLIWITFLGAALAFQQGRHIAVTVLTDALPPRVFRGTVAVARLVALAFLVALAVIGYRYMIMQGFQKSPALRLSMSYVYAVMPLASALMALLCLSDLVRGLFGPDPRPPRGPATS